MAIEAPLMIMLFASMVSPLKGSCPENTAAMFCNGANFAPQVYCSDVHLDDYLCTKKHNVWCGCSVGFARAKNNTCVRIETCETKSDVRKMYPLAETDVQETSSKLTELGKNVLALLKRAEDIYLTKISTHLEINEECVCLKSAFFVNGVDDGVERTLQCYYYVLSRAGHGSQANVPESQRLITRTQYAEFKVSTNGSQTVITVGNASLPSDVTHLNKHKLYLLGQFTVLQAALDCLLMELGKESDGTRICLLWTFVSSVSNEQSQCLDASNNLCKTPMKNVASYIGECNKHDAKENRADNKENEEFLGSASSEE